MSENSKLGYQIVGDWKSVSLEFYKFNFGWFNISNNDVELVFFFLLEVSQSLKVCLKHFYTWINLIFGGGGGRDWEDHHSEDKTISFMYESQAHGN